MISVTSLKNFQLCYLNVLIGTGISHLHLNFLSKKTQDILLFALLVLKTFDCVI